MVDLIDMHLIEWDSDSAGAAFSVVELPDELRERAEAARAEMIEAISEVDDEVMALFVDGPARFLKDSVAPPTFEALATLAGG